MPVAVQTGRTVPLGADGADDAGEFEWNVEVDAADDVGGDGRTPPTDEGDETDDDRFEWGSGVGPEDKS